LPTHYTYDPFGVTTASGTTSTNGGQFTGRENDGTGLYFYRARYLAPGMNRFVSEDPIDFQSGTTNLHSYTGNNPTNFVDPLGLTVKNFDPMNPMAVKPEDGPWRKLPPCMEWPGSPDGILPPGANDGASATGPWLKIPGKWYTPPNTVYVNARDKATCISGTCLVFPMVWTNTQPRGGPTDDSWNPHMPTADLPDLPGLRPIPGCSPDRPKSAK
jgi:RHS repeat-associated protein